MSDFDDIFKSSLEDYEMDVPDDMWSRIQESQDPQDRKVPFFFAYKWYLAALVGIAVIGLSIFYFTREDSSIEKQDKLPSLVAKTSDNPDLKSLIKASKSNTESLASTENISPNYISNSQSTLSDNINEHIVSVELLETNNEISGAFAQNVLTKNSGIAGIQESNRSIVAYQEIKSSSILPMEEQLDFNIDLLKPDYDKKCPKFGKTKTGYFSVEAFHSSDYNIKTLTSKTPEYESYALSRSETESARYSFSDGIKVKWHSNSGLVFGLGVERSQINERFVFVDEDAREVRILYSIDTLFMPDGTFTTSSDTTRIDINGVKLNDVHNRYTSIDLPINLSYQLELNKWALALNAGINVNLLFTQKGRILNISDEPVWSTPGSSNELDAFTAKSGLKFDGSISIIYHLTDNIDLMIEPYFRYNNTSITLEKYQLDQKYNTIGIRTGARYNFGF